MQARSLLVAWVITFAACSILAALSYRLVGSGSSVADSFSYILWPGVVLYTLLTGSLLFGPGYGAVGNVMVVVGGSALVWSIAVTLLVLAWARVLTVYRK